ncbi:MAG: Por secretion system C-terminal sorting protein [Akkermansiaceae bacterium]|nr:Por secretion system C-terminal sorting protein [Akkermansiaceae bacterium]
MKLIPTTGVLRSSVLRSLLLLLLGTGISPATVFTYRYFRFHPTKLRPTGTTLVQLAEFQFFNGTTPIPTAGVVVTDANNTTVPTATSETPDKAFDGITTTPANKWLDVSYLASELVFDFGTATAIDGYNFFTANDTPTRDPVSWTIEGTNDLNAGWTTLDVVTDFATNAARNAAASPTNFVLPVAPKPSILEFDQFDLTSGFIVKNGSSVNLFGQTALAASAAITSSAGGAALPVPTPNDGGQVAVIPPPNADTTYTLTATSAGGTATATYFIRSVSGATLNYRYVRYSPMALRGGGLSIQMSNFEFTNAGTKVPVATVTTTAPVQPNEGIANLIDTENGTVTKWFSATYKPVIFDFGSVQPFDSYAFSTANDSSDRDPVKWIIEGSTDGTTYTQIENMTTITYPTTLTRNTASPSIPLPGSNVAPSVTFTSTTPVVLPGDPVTLTYSTSGATSVTTTGFTSAGLSGTVTLNPTATTTYTVKATGASGLSTTNTLTVSVPVNPTGIINYPDFETAPEIATLGSAVILNDFVTFPSNPNKKRLRLTPQAGGQTGSAWSLLPVKLSDGFETTFDAQLVNTQFTNGADGIAFTIQNSPDRYLAMPSTEIQFASNAVTITLDSFNDHAADRNETQANLELFVGSSWKQTFNLSTAGTNPLSLAKGLNGNFLVTGAGVAPYKVRIVYIPGFLSVYLDDHLVVDKFAVNLADPAVGAVDATTGKGYVGFSARTGGLNEYQDILDWVLTPTTAVVTSPLAITSSVFTFGSPSSSLAVTWTSSAGKTYRITESSDLVTWTPVGSTVPSAGASTSTTVNFTKTTKDFYRVEEVAAAP